MRVVICTGGTGGHIYPALSLADAIMDENSENRILFVGTANHMEARLIPEKGYNFQTVEAAGFNGSLFNKLKSFGIMLNSVKDAKKIIRDFKADIVVGFGGYVSAPVVLAAKNLHLPILLHEQNAYAGRANLFLERFADKIIICYENVRKQFHKETLLLGNPRTYSAVRHENKEDLYDLYHLDKKRKTVLFVMGSQGSESVNKVLMEALQMFAGKNYQILYATGRGHYEEVMKNSFPDNVHVEPYIDQVGLLKDIDLIVTRGGATTASEIGVFGTPSIIIPSPYVPNNHQELNARALSDQNGAILLKEKDLSVEKLVQLCDDLMADDQKRAELTENARKIGYPRAAQDILKVMKECIHEHQ